MDNLMEQINKIYQIHYQSEAQDDLKEIALYYTQVADFEVAKRNIGRILDSIDGLEIMPYRCPVSDFSPNIRKLVVPKLPYLVFFKIINDVVYVLNIYSAKRNPKLLELKYKDF